VWGTWETGINHASYQRLFSNEETQAAVLDSQAELFAITFGRASLRTQMGSKHCLQ
jgi:hypothetical protein